MSQRGPYRSAKTADEGGYQPGAPGAGGGGIGESARVPARVVGDVDLDPAEHNLRNAGGSEGGQGGHTKD